MSIVLTATFDTRREAEMTVERLVQEFKFDRAAISVTAGGDANSAGVEPAGADDTGRASPDDAALTGAIVVSIDVPDEAAAAQVRDAFGEFNASGVVETDTDE
ncbi:hypothetical protein ACFOKI_09595 [Sphingomonas qilianensis]|uniref:Uncharacterized protein n=1 Tax=Sphingomonas qilianensis TaxID=1736690 RepID=A0ABU9XQA7_9SPHN